MPEWQGKWVAGCTHANSLPQTAALAIGAAVLLAVATAQYL